MDSLLAAFRDQPLTPRSLVGASPASTVGGTPASCSDGLPLTPRSPRSSPRGTGALSARKRGDECVRAPPSMRSPRGRNGTRAPSRGDGLAVPPPLAAMASYGAVPPPPAPPTTPVRGGVSKEAVRDVMAKVEHLSKIVRALALDGSAQDTAPRAPYGD